MRRVLLLVSVLGMAALAVPAARASGWSKVSLPKNSGLAAVSCVSVRSCEAVGSWRNRPVAEHWDGVRWSTQSIRGPGPSGDGVLAGVFCISSRACIAVGGTRAPLIERFDGRRWSIQTAPARSVAGSRFGANNVLHAVDCPTAKLCFAVGSTEPRGQGRVPGTPLIERWDGKRWRLVSTPGATGGLDSISCTSPRACSAVGGVELAQGPDSDPQLSDVALAERFDGTTWSAQPFPPAGATGAAPAGVSCFAARSCVAVGSSLQDDAINGGTVNGVDHAMTAAWDGSGWSSTTLPFPPAIGTPTAAGFPSDQLQAISCVSGSACAAVGIARDSAGRIGPLAARWDGTRWTQTLLHVGAPVALKSVSCVSARWCMAVGPTRAERYLG